ncbi:MAG: hypothetical protein ABIK47_05370 [candidate division WOR-3 bacterium]
MGFNWVDILSIGVVALIGALQFLRAIRDFSLVFYETIFMVAAVVGAVRFYPFVQRLTRFPAVASFALVFIIFLFLAFLCASLLNSFIGFEFGIFSYFFGLGLAIVCGFAFGHVVLRALSIGSSPTRPDIIVSIKRSWMASQVLYFGAFREFLGILRIARYNKI